MTDLDQLHGNRQKSQQTKRKTNFLPVLDFSYTENVRNQNHQQDNLEERLHKLEGNLKILEKRYRQNLKDGFQNKIKAYRLQAVVQRKLIKQAIKQNQKTLEEEALKQRLAKTIEHQQMYQSRFRIINQKKQERFHYLKEKNQQEKKNIALITQEKQRQYEKMAKQMHDKIIEEEENGDRKRRYLENLRQKSKKKEENQLKKDFLEKIIKNTENLKSLKNTLEEMKTSKMKDRHPFLTI